MSDEYTLEFILASSIASKARIESLEKQLAAETERAYNAEGINLAVVEQMKSIGRTEGNIKSDGIEEAIHNTPYPQDMPSIDAALLNYDNSLLNFANSLKTKAMIEA